MRMLVIERRTPATASLTEDLRLTGHDILTADTSSDALRLHGQAETILIDLGLRDADGFELCRLIRARTDKPIIAFADPGTGVDQVRALLAGADDCLDRTCQLRELLARVDAVTRRTRGRAGGPARRGTVSLNGLCIDPDTRDVRVHGRPVGLTRKEFDLLYHLATHEGSVLSREQLMAEVWGDSTTHARNSRGSRTIDTHISSLRGKLGSEWIHTVRGVGFRIGRH